MTKCQILKSLRRTLGILFIFLVGNISLVFGAVDCYITPWGAPPWISPDIYVDNSGNGIQECGEPSKGITNRLFARIHNIGADTATNIKVRFYYTPYSAGYNLAAFKQIGDPVIIPSLAGSSNILLETGWDLSNLGEDNGGLWPDPISQFDHFCVHVTIECAGEANTSNNEAQTNFTAVPCYRIKLTDTTLPNCGFNFIIANPKPVRAKAGLVISGLPKGWAIHIRARGIENIQEFTLDPNEARPARLEFSHPEGQDEMSKNISVSLKLDGELISGFSFKPVLTPFKRHKFSLSLHTGYTIPLGTFNEVYNSGPSVFVDVDYHFLNQFSVVLLFGYNGFHAGFPHIKNTYWWNFSANLKKEFTVAPKLNFFLNGGPGIYIPKNGPGKPGFNVGLGFNYSLSNSWKLEFGNDYHHIFGKAKVRFIVTHVGFIYSY